MVVDKGDKFLLLADPEGGFTLVAEDRDGFKAGSTRFGERVDASKFFYVLCRVCWVRCLGW